MLDRPLPPELGLQIGVPVSEVIERVLRPIVLAKRTKQAGPVEPRALKDVSNRDEAFVVSNLRISRAEPHEAPLEASERNRAARGSEAAPCRLRIVTLEVLCEALVQPRRDSSRRQIRDHRVRQFMDEHAFE